MEICPMSTANAITKAMVWSFMEPPEPQIDSESDTSYDESVFGTAGGWQRRPFQTPNMAFQEDLDGAPAFEDGMPSLYQYFSPYVPKSVLLELSDKTNTSTSCFRMDAQSEQMGKNLGVLSHFTSQWVFCAIQGCDSTGNQA
ncbi:hypothetical protein HPB48_010379 [Haemaphysalis longicornis]|uniref:Uncharacterized protein n=1 Tax=Haemaphysalis longicornis TaxID=44386 RepID=A0A9J6GLD2_HAELO|nr:hypothetical protein HPB48_010379 [Haemaphysalis longicornis]